MGLRLKALTAKQSQIREAAHLPECRPAQRRVRRVQECQPTTLRHRRLQQSPRKRRHEAKPPKRCPRTFPFKAGHDRRRRVDLLAHLLVPGMLFSNLSVNQRRKSCRLNRLGLVHSRFLTSLLNNPFKLFLKRLSRIPRCSSFRLKCTMRHGTTEWRSMTPE